MKNPATMKAIKEAYQSEDREHALELLKSKLLLKSIKNTFKTIKSNL